MQSVLFVCLGNICRSPSAEACLRARRPDLRLDSAGTGDWHVGEAPYGPMQKAAAQRGITMSDLRARQVQARDFHDFDLIVAMDAENHADLLALRPSDATAELVQLAQFGPGTPDHIPDPYFTRDFAGALDLIELCLDGLEADRLRRG